MCGTRPDWAKRSPAILSSVKKDGDGTDPTLAEAEVAGGEVERNTFCLADFSCSFLGPGEIAATDQQGQVGVRFAQEPCRPATDDAGAADE